MAARIIRFLHLNELECQFIQIQEKHPILGPAWAIWPMQVSKKEQKRPFFGGLHVDSARAGGKKRHYSG